MWLLPKILHTLGIGQIENAKLRKMHQNPLDEPHLRRFRTLLAAMKEESPRGMVLTTSSLIDEHLAECLVARMVDHNAVLKLTKGFNAPFGTFSARIVGALAVGLINDDEHHDLEIIRGIRNDFAHQIEVSFDDQSIKDRCGNFRLKAHDYEEVVVDPQSQFSTAAISMIMRLTNRAAYAERSRLKPVFWPL